MQFYDPNKLIEDVQALLRSDGLTADITDSLTAQIGASTLLRGLGITPAIDAEDAYARILESGPWPDADDRRARSD
ncbi:MAG TPA: hypothetical protein VH593_22890 [Ktedonobacteraceae bacterium]|jgi:hypothetical protein